MGKIKIIAAREFNERVRKKSFIITTILMPLFFVAMIVIMVVMMNVRSDKTKTILVVDQSGIIADRLEDKGTLVFESSDRTFDELRAEQRDNIFGILVVGSDVAENPKNIQLVTYEASTVMIESDITEQIRSIIEADKLKKYNIDNLSEILDEIKTPVSLSVSQIKESGEVKNSSATLNIVLAYILGFLIYMFIFLYGGMVMQGVIEEKSNKVLEVMVSSVKPFQLMMGKILGIASVALTQLVIWVVFIVVVGGLAVKLISPDLVGAAQAMQATGFSATPQGMGINLDADTAGIIATITSPGYLLRIFGGFLLFFIGGYLLYAAMFAAVGSAVDNEKDTQNLQMPITIPLVLAIFVMINAMQDPNGQLAFWFSMIPFTSPILMMVRLPYGVPAWEFWLSVALLYGTFVGTVWLAGKVYRVGIFMYGKKPTFKELAKWVRYKS